jgi:NADH-quinone oxidoreductase subunit L
MGKSAQLGLHTWLPDAMEGPTPVSALIHAATMVTAGVFLVARMSPLFEYATVTNLFITFIGAATAIFAATIALTQNDIKRVIAYSTCSQLGYMFFAAGLGAYNASIFHLMTHGFFKALLFLSAGSVIHAMHHEQDMRKMGGLFKKIPFTGMMMWIGSLAIIGFPYFSGYYSKESILENAYYSDSSMATFAIMPECHEVPHAQIKMRWESAIRCRKLRSPSSLSFSNPPNLMPMLENAVFCSGLPTPSAF